MMDVLPRTITNALSPLSRLREKGGICPTPLAYRRERRDAVPSRPRGFVLIVVLVVAAMLSLTAMSFVGLMSTENKAVHLRGEELEAQCLVGSAEASVQAMLDLSEDARQAAGGAYDNAAWFRGVLVLGEERSRHRGRFSVVSPRGPEDGSEGIRFGLADESARLNLAALPDWERRAPGAARAALMNLPGMTEAVADAILDWMDGDSSPRPFGAEADAYAGADVPYAPRNAVPGCVEELLLVKGVTRGRLFGADANHNYQIEPSEAPQGSSSDGPPWATLVTLHGARRNVNPAGKPRVNLNDDDLAKVHRELAGRIDETWARFIILYRQYGGRVATDAPSAGGGAGAASSTEPADVRLDFSVPAKVKLDSVLDLVDAWVALPARGPQPPARVPSPFANDPIQMADYLPKLLDETAVTAESVLRGQVNVNAAPREVLLGVPGLDEATVAQIVATRPSRGDTSVDPARRHPTWLLTEGLITLDTMKTALPWLTAGGDVYRAQLIGFFDDSRAVARTEVVIDATATPPRRVYWKDLSPWGPGFTRESLGGTSDQTDALATW
ncbi:MAG: general secretion pathway protein GspK [Pirellulales bacterium]|nr:general secretion pathway protein GspK [Pirellulales bacterium]